MSALLERLQTSPTPRITVVGSINLDLAVRAERLPRPGETLAGREFHLFPGGKGANQAVAAARLGAQVRMVGRVGQDDFAERALSGLVEAGVDLTDVVRDAEQPTGVASIVVDAQGENTIVVVVGANGAWSAADMARAERAAGEAQVVLLQLEVPLEVVLRTAHAARRAGVRVLLNPAPARPLPRPLFAEIDVLTPNATEAISLAGLDREDPEQAARRLAQHGVRAVVLTLGAEGVLVLEGGQLQHVPGFQVSPVDTTAAGDAFNGALAFALARGLDLADAARLGCAAGALAATKPGAQPSLPTLEEVLQLLREHNG